MALGFYAGVATFLPLAIGPQHDRLAAIATGAAWVALALASLLSLERMFERDYEDGALTRPSVARAPGADVPGEVPGAMAGRRRAAGPRGARRRHRARRQPGAGPLVFACALLGGVAFAFIGGIGASLSLGARRGGLLTAVIVLPLFVPPVIFGGGALANFEAGLPWTGGLAFLGAYAAAAVAFGPLAMAAACRNALS